MGFNHCHVEVELRWVGVWAGGRASSSGSFEFSSDGMMTRCLPPALVYVAGFSDYAGTNKNIPVSVFQYYLNPDMDINGNMVSNTAPLFGAPSTSLCKFTSGWLSLSSNTTTYKEKLQLYLSSVAITALVSVRVAGWRLRVPLRA